MLVASPPSQMIKLDERLGRTAAQHQEVPGKEIDSVSEIILQKQHCLLRRQHVASGAVDRNEASKVSTPSKRNDSKRQFLNYDHHPSRVEIQKLQHFMKKVEIIYATVNFEKEITQVSES